MRHGRAMYSRGCRCDVCKRARRDAARRYMAGERAPAPSSCQQCGGPLVQKRGHPRSYCSARCEYLAKRRDLCACGGTKARDAERCMRCFAVARRDTEMRERVVRLWAEGLTLRELAVAMSWSNGRVAATMINRLRADGVDLPYRRSAETRAKMVEAVERRRAA